MKQFLLFLSLCLSIQGLAQDKSAPVPTTFYKSLGSWNIVNVRATLSDNWSVFAEGQVRSTSFYDNFHYYEVKGGFNYRVNKTSSFTAGIGRYDTYTEGGDFISPKANNELRSWVQFNTCTSGQRLRLEHRYRAEQRWATNGYRNRFRYRLNAVYPLNGDKVEPGVIFLSAWDEIFLTNKASFFERNRYFMGAGYQFSPIFTLQSGFINQYDYRPNGSRSRNFLQISLLYDLDLRKQGE
jgi:hypothetical protein